MMRFSVLAMMLCAAAIQADERQWQLEREEDGVSVYLADVPGSKYKAYRGVVTINADLAAVQAVQEDVTGSCSWIFSCQQQRLLETDGDVSELYTRFEMPWPVKARDSVIQVTTRTDGDGGVTRLLKAVPQRLPEEKGFVRVQRVDGQWRLKPLGEGRVEVIYEVHTEPGGSVPSWLANSFVVDAPLQTLQGLRAKVEGR
ncbi:START domain-containing protein [Ectopseudomonas alcaliphila]|uniref:START domain-containing protein n=1 Tax=Ectopseudomonas alcaliphila TaxID=101564 RepID=A0A1G7DXZ3_9GAMM|nr:START domain-containing protein [Pseudomonas alcaliphila]MDX5990644.1 START domain-containing protein [Pseudomonas alcaliphila]SDE56377.1 START domain-containing protein [Pseudomonas alcaliphila]